MKSLLLSAVLALTPGLAVAASYGNATSTPIVSYQEYPRTLQFSNFRNAIAENGTIMVCEYPNEVGTRDNTCYDAKGQNKWTPIDRLKIAGHTLAGYHWVFSYTLGSSTLILYFSPK